ncbi:hypothetical protein JL100_002920 [Skermanella mucosa]|uniref:hypothetical protein n=1 Tax=Skermanella mucosa TaxID=1789672 RepID=UPI001E2890B6|nr:hypothetical protein [Skermanella mucosa]UEM21735.1 hypothetical protein JL100_002920 [Skermanella mucosa]
MPLLPQQIAPVDERQAALTEAHLSDRIGALMDYFLALRAETDAVLAPRLAAAAGKPYPYGRCAEINSDLFARMAGRVKQPATDVERTLHDFVSQGGVIRTVWGVLRGQYFQNAIQFGGLYVDVSNDTVVVTKPKVEILPIAESGLVPVRDLAHFRATAESYWGAAIYANHLVPSLAPLLPMISASPGRLRPGMQSACDYMIALMCRDGFRQAEDWLRDGPTPPPEIAAAVLASIPPDLRARTADGRTEALDACRWARASGCDRDQGWRDVRVSEYLRTVRT